MAAARGTWLSRSKNTNKEFTLEQLRLFLGSVLSSVRDLLPIVLVVAFFQVVVLQEPVPNLERILVGSLLVVLGLAFFVRGLEQGLFPIGESIAYAFARKGNLFWLLLFAFALGFGTTIAEPALIAIAEEASEVAAAAGFIEHHEESMEDYAFGLRLPVALSVGFAILVGVYRIIKGWPIQYFIIAGYIGVVIMTSMAPPEIIDAVRRAKPSLPTGSSWEPLWNHSENVIVGSFSTGSKIALPT